MMDTIVPERKWHLIRNDNGEWISDDNAVEVSKEDVQRLKLMAMRANKNLSVQHGMEGCLWCYKHEFEAINNPYNINKEVMKKEMNIDELKSELGMDVKFPQKYKYFYDKSQKVLTLKLLECGLMANMQEDESAFESWALVLKYYSKDKIETVIIDWEDIPAKEKDGTYHYNRFVYRLAKFSQSYDWVELAKPLPQMPTTLVCNFPNGEAAKQNEHTRGSEGFIECMYVEREKGNYDCINHQFPVGLFDYKVSSKTYFTPGQKSAIDIWAIKDKTFYIFELKKFGNKPLGIISELMFYTNVVFDLLSHRIQYKTDNKLKNSIEKNYRGFGDFYKAYVNGSVVEINAVLLADSFHPLITNDLLAFINNSARFKFVNISFSMQKYI